MQLSERQNLARSICLLPICVSWVCFGLLSSTFAETEQARLAKNALHVAVVGRKDDPKAAELFTAANRYPDADKLVEWIDFREGKKAVTGIDYPVLPQAAAFVCVNRRCSLPIFRAEGIATTIQKFLAPPIAE